MGIINYCDEDTIKQEVKDRYDEYRPDHSNPRTQHEKRQMIEFILNPLLDRLSSWTVYEKTAQHKLEEIQGIITD